MAKSKRTYRKRIEVGLQHKGWSPVLVFREVRFDGDLGFEVFRFQPTLSTAAWLARELTGYVTSHLLRMERRRKGDK